MDKPSLIDLAKVVANNAFAVESAKVDESCAAREYQMAKTRRYNAESALKSARQALDKALDELMPPKFGTGLVTESNIPPQTTSNVSLSGYP